MCGVWGPLMSRPREATSVPTRTECGSSPGRGERMGRNQFAEIIFFAENSLQNFQALQKNILTPPLPCPSAIDRDKTRSVARPGARP